VVALIWLLAGVHPQVITQFTKRCEEFILTDALWVLALEDFLISSVVCHSLELVNSVLVSIRCWLVNLDAGAVEVATLGLEDGGLLRHLVLGDQLINHLLAEYGLE